MRLISVSMPALLSGTSAVEKGQVTREEHLQTDATMWTVAGESYS
jgi:hypothetical protein